MAYTVVPASGTGAAIVNLDGTPAIRATAGQGAIARAFLIEGSATAPINMPTTNFLPLVRIPTRAIVKSVKLALDAAPSTSLTGSLGIVFSPAFDGTSASLQSVYALTGAAPAIVSQSCFLYQTDITTYTAGFTDVTFKNAAGNSVTDGFYVPSAITKPLWQALGAGGTAALGKATSGASPGAFSTCQTDPGGFFDICWFETTTGVNTAAVVLTCRVEFTSSAT